MKKCIICGKSHNRKENICSMHCLDIHCYGSKEKAREATVNAFAQIGIKAT